MILLDTNVLSALMQREPPEKAIAWFGRQAPEDLWTTAVSVFEIRFGLALLAEGARRRRLEEEFEKVLGNDLEGRIAAFDHPAAVAAAALAARRRLRGRTVEVRDTQIAGIALARRAGLATRNLRDFDDLPEVVDPWTAT